MQVLLIKQRPRRSIQRVLLLAHQHRVQCPISHQALKHILDPVMLLEVRQINLTLRSQQAGMPQGHQQVLRHGSIGLAGVLRRETDVISEDTANLTPTQGALVWVREEEEG